MSYYLFPLFSALVFQFLIPILAISSSTHSIQLFLSFPRCSDSSFPRDNGIHSHFVQIYDLATYSVVPSHTTILWSLYRSYNSLCFFCTVHSLSLLHKFFLILSSRLHMAICYGLPLSCTHACVITGLTIAVYIFSFVFLVMFLYRNKMYSASKLLFRTCILFPSSHFWSISEPR